MSAGSWEVLSQGSWKKLTLDESTRIHIALENSLQSVVLKNANYYITFSTASSGHLKSSTNSPVTLPIRKIENNNQPTKPTDDGSSAPRSAAVSSYTSKYAYAGQACPSSHHKPNAKPSYSSGAPQTSFPAPLQLQQSDNLAELSSSQAYSGTEGGIPNQIPKPSISIRGPPMGSHAFPAHSSSFVISPSQSHGTKGGLPNQTSQSSIRISGPPGSSQTHQTHQMSSDSGVPSGGLGPSLYHAWKETVGSSRPPTKEYNKLLFRLSNSSNAEKHSALVGFFHSTSAKYATNNFTADAVHLNGDTTCLDAQIRTKTVRTQELVNESSYHMEWSCSKGFLSSSAFLSIHPSSGSLAPNERVTITIVGTLLSERVGQMQLVHLVVISLKYAITEHNLSEFLFLPFLIHIKGTNDRKCPYWYIENDQLENPSLLKQGSNATLYSTHLFNAIVVKKVFFSQHVYKTELEILQKIDHPNVIRFIGASPPDSKESFVILEYCVNGTLQSYYAKQDLHLNFKWALSFSHQLCGAVRALHDAGFLHRDIRCGHVLVTSEGEPRLIDFSLVCSVNAVASSNAATHSKKTFIAPESYCNGVYTKSSDVFSLGMVMLELTARDKQERTFFDLAVGLVPDVSPNLANWSPKFSALIYHYCCNSSATMRPDIATVEKILLGLRCEPN